MRLHELKQGKQYYIFATTFDGLYRYNINDIVKVKEFYLNTPCLEFVQKGKGTTNITGEKLYENQLVKAVKKAQKKFNYPSLFLFAWLTKDIYPIHCMLKALPAQSLCFRI